MVCCEWNGNCAQWFSIFFIKWKSIWTVPWFLSNQNEINLFTSVRYTMASFENWTDFIIANIDEQQDWHVIPMNDSTAHWRDGLNGNFHHLHIFGLLFLRLFFFFHSISIHFIFSWHFLHFIFKGSRASPVWYDAFHDEHEIGSQPCLRVLRNDQVESGRK